MTSPMTSPMTTSNATGRRGVWAAGFVVAVGAGIATAHGLFEVAIAARVPAPIGWLYPLITDGLALVAYAATSRLAEAGRRYAAGIVVLAAGLSGLAQAVYLAGGIAQTSVAPVGLRFGVGAWPAVAAALTAHLLHLIGTGAAGEEAAALTLTSQPAAAGPVSSGTDVHPYNPLDVQPYGAYSPVFNPGAVQPPRTTGEPDAAAVQPERSTSPYNPAPDHPGRGRSGPAGGGAGARDRARSAARHHYAQHGELPTVSELVEVAKVARGTAGVVLKGLRAEPPALHLVNALLDQDTDS